MTENILIVGGSRGIGLAVADYYHDKVDGLMCVSRSPSKFGKWIEADISKQQGIDKVCATFDNKPLDALLFLGGTWEKGAFTSDYNFINSSYEEIDHVIAVNLIAPVKLIKGLISSLKKSQAPKVIFIGSLSGLDNQATREVANTASKFGLRGAAQALQIELSNTGIAFTVINPGNIATPEVLNDIASSTFSAQVPIPLSDLICVIDCCLKLSRASCMSEINLTQLNPLATDTTDVTDS
ncbi:oxidoreductase [Dulcicalothrix desertica PCC 7102]|uniref:Oxidoreductase n=1 Tax=Dulcicalothrix desertica PCC 7102 TaxID=232991 RepID=A0A3S1CI89_9CYAN|nr:SDR family oxidoreductase [Dulcicalothrix desertica]RUT07889.1 oxidoreductase [Dulcicalothrix desertica PCC 7102]TWH39410.1 short-subunit dehydrogenase [Dulcicalothrix desertica PCC 7102]